MPDHFPEHATQAMKNYLRNLGSEGETSQPEFKIQYDRMIYGERKKLSSKELQAFEAAFKRQPEAIPYMEANYVRTFRENGDFECRFNHFDETPSITKRVPTSNSSYVITIGKYEKTDPANAAPAPAQKAADEKVLIFCENVPITQKPNLLDHPKAKDISAANAFLYFNGTAKDTDIVKGTGAASSAITAKTNTATLVFRERSHDPKKDHAQGIIKSKYECKIDEHGKAVDPGNLPEGVFDTIVQSIEEVLAKTKTEEGRAKKNIPNFRAEVAPEQQQQRQQEQQPTRAYSPKSLIALNGNGRGGIT